MKAILDWPRRRPRKRNQPGIDGNRRSAQLGDEEVNRKLAEMEAARKARDFKTSDALRAELTTAGIIVENTKEGVRWRRSERLCNL